MNTTSVVCDNHDTIGKIGGHFWLIYYINKINAFMLLFSVKISL